jgi:kynurenine formamidase
MLATIEHPLKKITIDLSKPIDISIPLEAGPGKLSAWYVDPVRIEPVRTKDWVGDVNEGGSVNFRNIYFNPHGHGTHTECVGHISKEWISINQELKSYFFLAKLITVAPEISGDDHIISRSQISKALGNDPCEALVIRTLPNERSKMTRQYSNTNPPYLHNDAALFIRDAGIDHLLIDLPSVDKEHDDGKLMAHHAFWNYPEQTRMHATITEFIFVPNEIADGMYLLNMQIAPFENDASPSKPVLYRIK